MGPGREAGGARGRDGRRADIPCRPPSAPTPFLARSVAGLILPLSHVLDFYLGD